MAQDKRGNDNFQSGKRLASTKEMSEFEGKRDKAADEKGSASWSHSRESGSRDASPETVDDSNDLESISNRTDETDKGLEDLQQEELTGANEDSIRAVGYSDTDEDEDEGLGDGNLGRTVRGGVDE